VTRWGEVKAPYAWTTLDAKRGTARSESDQRPAAKGTNRATAPNAIKKTPAARFRNAAKVMRF
jgi:hypothetical protein